MTIRDVAYVLEFSELSMTAFFLTGGDLVPSIRPNAAMKSSDLDSRAEQDVDTPGRRKFIPLDL